MQDQARVDEYLEWQHLNIRLYCSTYVRLKLIMPAMGKNIDEACLNKAKKEMIKIIDFVQEVWLANSTYLAGDKISVADIMAATELEQTSKAHPVVAIHI